MNGKAALPLCLTLIGFGWCQECLLTPVCVQGLKHEAACLASSSPAEQTRKRKRQAQDGSTVIDLSQEPAEGQPHTAALPSKRDKLPDAKQESACMRPDPPKKPCEATPAQQQTEHRAETPEERAALLAKLTAEAASLKQHVLGMQPLAPLTAENSEPSLSRSQVGFTMLLHSLPCQVILAHLDMRQECRRKQSPWYAGSSALDGL